MYKNKFNFSDDKNITQENSWLSDSSFEIAHFKGDEDINECTEGFEFNGSKHHFWGN